MERFALHNAARACACPGSLQLNARVTLEPDPDREKKKHEGKLADWCIAQLFDGVEPTGVPDDMIDHVTGYYNHIIETLTADGIPRDAITSASVEQSVNLAWLTAGDKSIPVIDGRPDFKFYWPGTHTLYVWDFKYGHRPVEAIGNAQLAGAVLADEPYRQSIEHARCFIYQPRDFISGKVVKEWRLTRDGILMQNQRFRMARLDSMRPDAPLCTGSHCRDCNAPGICPALWEDIEMAKSVLDAPSSATPQHVGERLAIALQLYEQSGYLKDNLTAQGLHMVKNQQHVPGFKAVRGVTQRRVKDAETLIAMAPLYGLTVDDVTERKPIALGKLQKAFDEATLNEFTVKPEGRLEFVPENDKRQAVIQTNAAEVFAEQPKMPGA